MESWVQSWRPRTNAFCDFSTPPVYEKLMPGHTAPVTQKKKQNWRWCSKMQPLSGNQRPDLLTSLMNMSLVLRLPRDMHLCRSSSNVPRLPSFLELLQNPRVLLKLQNPLHLPRKITSEPSKSGPRMVCFVHFDFEICFAPQRRALFQHLNFQKCSERGVFCTFWLRNVLRATTVCTFSTSQLPKVIRSRGVLYTLTWKCASRHNGVQFFISHLARWLRTRRFSEPTFRPFGATNHWKNTVFRDFPTFSRTWIFFLRRLSLFWYSFFVLFCSLLFSDSSHLCFSSVHIVGSLTSKLPSMTIQCVRHRWPTLDDDDADDDDDHDDDDEDEDDGDDDDDDDDVWAFAVEMHTDIPQEPFGMDIYWENAKRDGYHLDWTPGLNCYRKNPCVWPHCLGKHRLNLCQFYESYDHLQAYLARSMDRRSASVCVFDKSTKLLCFSQLQTQGRRSSALELVRRWHLSWTLWLELVQRQLHPDPWSGPSSWSVRWSAKDVIPKATLEKDLQDSTSFCSNWCLASIFCITPL